MEMGGEMKHDKIHWRCCWLPLLGLFLWFAAAVSLVLAWVAVSRKAPVLGYADIGWYLNAIVLSLLAIPLKLKRGWCKMHGGSCGSGDCGMHGEMK